MAITPLPLPQPGDTNWAGPLNASLEQLNQDVGEISETGQGILDAVGVAQQSATDAEAAAVRAEAVPAQVDGAMVAVLDDPASEFTVALTAQIGEAVALNPTLALTPTGTPGIYLIGTE